MDTGPGGNDAPAPSAAASGGALARAATHLGRALTGRGRHRRPRDVETPPLLRAAAQDPRLSYRARGVLAELWSHKPGRRFTAAALYRSSMTAEAVEGREAIYRAVAELRAVGYIRPAPGEPDGRWTTRYVLDRTASPRGPSTGFVHVPWSVVRDQAVSYRARGLLVARLSYGATLQGQTVAVHRGGVQALTGGHPVEGARAVGAALTELLTSGYAIRIRGRDDAGRIAWKVLFRTGDPSAEHADAPVDNPPADTPGVTCGDAESSQVTPITTKPGTHLQERIPGSNRGEHQGTERRGGTSGARPVTAAQVADAPAREPLREPKTTTSTAKNAKRSASAAAWQLLGSRLLRPYRDGAPPWVRRLLALRLEVMLADGATARAIAATAAAVARERPIGAREHLDALRAVRARLRADLAHGDICPECGTPTERQFDTGCRACGPLPMTVYDIIDLECLECEEVS